MSLFLKDKVLCFNMLSTGNWIKANLIIKGFLITLQNEWMPFCNTVFRSVLLIKDTVASTRLLSDLQESKAETQLSNLLN